MARPALHQALTRIAEPVVHALGLEIWGIEILQSGRPVVRIYVDAPPAALAPAAPQAADSEAASPQSASPESVSPESVSIDQCAEISRMVGLALEVEEIFASAYVLEVSSPGLSRSFFQPGQLPPYVGQAIEMTLNEAHPDFYGRKKFRGCLSSVDGNRLTLALEDGGELSVDWEEVRKAARIHVFAMPEKPGKKRKDEK